jgi:hypothetical protein
MKTVLLLAPLLLLAACERTQVNPPTEPAQAITSPTVDGATDAPAASMAPLMPGTGPTSFIGRWSIDPALCAAAQGERRPIEFTSTRFEGYGAGCDIARIDEVMGGYQATLSCPAPTGAHVERVQMSVVGQALALTWIDRKRPDGTPLSAKLLKCTTLTDTSSKAPALPMP